MLELLSPAGSPEAVVAAVQSGADAIYLGLGGFNARRGAKNFTEEEFLQTAAYCRERGCKIYVTINTLASDRELEEVARLGRFVCQAGAGGAIVQDLGAAKVLREVCPELELHASTQMSIHNLAGAYAAAQLGMKRVVLARELNMEQIKHITRHSPIETEVFIHGALCFCHSGQCYMSALIGRRSGNRGMCAQPCRMEYSMGRRMDGYPLSLKDNCLIDYVSELEEAGVACVKIEGRMKRPEYSAIVTEIYAKAIHDRIAPTEKDMDRLKMAFSRDGFTDGYISGKKEDMHGVRTEPDKEVNRLFTEARRAYASSELRRVPIDFYAVVQENEPVRVLVQDCDGNKVGLFGPKPEKAERAALSQKSISDQLYKTGGTPYRCRSVNCSVDPGLFLPASALNELRRQALEQLSEKRRAVPEFRFGSMPQLKKPPFKPASPVLNVQLLSPEQFTPELAALRPHIVYAPVELLCENFELTEPFIKEGCRIVPVLPRVVCDDECAKLLPMLEDLRKKGLDEALVGNLGHISLARQSGFEVRGDFGLNVFNSHSIDVLKDAGLRSVTASFELRLAQVRDLLKPIDTELIVYGRLPCMVTDQCIIRKSSGSCSCRNGASLSDRMGSVFPIVKEFGCRNVIYNAHKLFLADKPEDILSCGLWGARLMFTTESPRECVEVTKSYMGLSQYSPNGLTRGLYYRGVE